MFVFPEPPLLRLEFQFSEFKGCLDIISKNMLLTFQPTTKALPTYVPKACGPSRISSACSCVASSTAASSATATPTTAPTACSTGQVVVNPSFYGYPTIGGDLSPWTIEHDSGATGCTHNKNSYSEAASDSYFGDPRSMYVVHSISLVDGSKCCDNCNPFQ